MMKKLLLTTGVIFTMISASTAQDAARTTTTDHSAAEYISIGPVAGFGVSGVGNMGGTSKFMPSGYLGIGLVYARNEHWGWGGQLQVAGEGYRVEYNNATVTAMPIYLRMPIRGYYFFGDYRNTIRPKVYLGPSFGLKLGENDDNINSTGDHTMAMNTGTFRTFDLGINAGAGVNIKLAKATWLNLDLGYTQGVLDVVKDRADNYNVNHNLDLSVGVLFGIR